jgi:hypothetical protein
MGQPMHPIQSLYEIVDAFHHERAERQRQPPEGSRRRKHAHRLEELESAFDRLVEHWIDDEWERQRWRDYLSHGGEHPGTPVPPDPPLFVGRSDDDGIAEMRRHAEVLEVFIDGQLVGDAARWTGASVTMGDIVYHEVTRVTDEALDALGEYVEGGTGSPPWSHTRVLYEDGLIDENVSLTDRGRRILELRARG